MHSAAGAANPRPVTIPAVSTELTGQPASRRGSRAAWIMVALTAAACLVALFFRTPLRSRYWAGRIAATTDPAERALYLTALCNAGEGAWWGITALLDSDRADVREYGMVVLQHVKSPRANQRLLAALHDTDDAVRELAALGLAIQGDNTIIPALTQLYARGDVRAAQSACLALARLGTQDAIAALSQWAAQPAEPTWRAALVDALEALGSPACVPPLIQLLSDHRACDVPPHGALPTRDVLAGVAAEGAVGAPPALTESQAAGQTIAERAAAALEHITGLHPPFSSTLPADQQAAAAAEWSSWTAPAAGPP
jgi:HEAT repeat protein